MCCRTGDIWRALFQQQQTPLHKMGLQYQYQVHRLCFGHSQFTYMHIYIYIHVYAQLFPKLQTWHWHFKLDFWIGAYRVLEKSSSYMQYCMITFVFYSHIINRLVDYWWSAAMVIYIDCEKWMVSILSVMLIIFTCWHWNLHQIPKWYLFCQWC